MTFFAHSRTAVAKWKNLVTVTLRDIVEFLAFKDISGAGRTVVPDIICATLGEPYISFQCDPIKYMMIKAAESLQM